MSLNGSPSMQETMQQWIQSYMENVHTCLPGRIESYNPTTRKATVQPTVSQWFQNGDATTIVPAIKAVPVCILGNSVASVEVEVQPGDGCILLFAETGIGDYMSGTSTKVTCGDDPSRHNLTDAICIPFLWPFSAVPKAGSKLSFGKDGSVSLTASSGASFSLAKDGKVALSSKSTDLKSLVQQLNTALTDIHVLLATFMGAASQDKIAVTTATAATSYIGAAATTLDIDLPKVSTLQLELFE